MLMCFRIVDDLIMMSILSFHNVIVCTLPIVFPLRSVAVL